MPTQQLGLSQDYVTNNYDWKYIYAVQADQAVTGTYDSTERDLVINFEGGGSTTSAFVVINPGADGKGSRNANGSVVGDLIFAVLDVSRKLKLFFISRV